MFRIGLLFFIFYFKINNQITTIDFKFVLDILRSKLQLTENIVEFRCFILLLLNFDFKKFVLFLIQ
jgi:hypothetical protein